LLPSACGTAPAALPQLSIDIDISCPQGAQQQTRRPPLLLSIDGTDRRIPDRYTDPTPHTYIHTLYIQIYIARQNRENESEALTCVNEFIFAVASIQQIVCEFRLHHMGYTASRSRRDAMMSAAASAAAAPIALSCEQKFSLAKIQSHKSNLGVKG